MFAKGIVRQGNWFWFCLAILWPGATRAESREYQIKAAFLVNFVQFISWPDNALRDSATPFCIGVLGDDPFGAALDQAVHGETFKHHKIAVVRSRNVEDCKDCQLVFVSPSEEKKVSAILARLDSSPVLTVGETSDFARRGGIINFYLEGNKVRFEINPGVAKRDKLYISSQLLSLGKIVESGDTPK